MGKVNPYYEILDKHNENAIAQLTSLSETTLSQMNECKLLYSKQGQQIKINQIYSDAIKKAEEFKTNQIALLKTLLDGEKVKLQPKPVTDMNERILNELVKMNNFNSFSTNLTHMTVQEILEYEQDKYLSEQEVNLIKSELTKRADKLEGQEGLDLLVKQRQLNHIPKTKLLEQAYERIEQYNLDSNMFPGMPISNSLTGGVEKLMGKEILDKVNEVNYFGGNE
ncbi:MAG: hypothetical protein ACRC7S_17435 [Cetobacterium sp.]